MTRIHKTFIKHQRLRSSFKKLLAAYRCRRWRARPLNTDDPFTLCEPEKPLTLYDPPSKGIYTFDSAPLLKHIYKALLHHDGLYDEPLYPTNPLTNLPFHIGQLTFLHNTLKATGHSHWAFDLFRLCSFSMVQFQIQHAFQLKKHAIASVFADTSSIDFREYFTNFLEEAYGDQDIDYPSAIYNWAIKHRLDTPYMTCWVDLAKEYALKRLESEYHFHDIDEDTFTIKKGALIRSSAFNKLRADYLLNRRVGAAYVLVQSPIAHEDSSND